MNRRRRFGRLCRRGGGLAALGASALAVALAAACGGSDGKDPHRPAEESGDSSERTVMIPENRFVEIESLFDRRRPMITRCYNTASEAGEIEEDAEGHVTVGLTILESGQAQDVHILETSFDSQLFESCVVERVSQWDFGELPRPLEYSRGFAFRPY